MPTLEKLTEADLNSYFKAKSLKKARSSRSQVSHLTRSGHTLQGQVLGSRRYQVEIDVEPDGIYAQCSCPYDWGGYCKHIGAVLLVWIQSPEQFVEQEAPAPAEKEPLEVTPVEPPASQRPSELPEWIRYPFARRHQLEQENLAQDLEHLKMQELRDMAAKRGWQVKGTRKADLVEQVIEQLTDPTDILQAYDNLDDEHRRVFRAMALLGNAPGVTEQDLEKVATRDGRLSKYKQVSTYLRRLAESGLAANNELYAYPPPPPVYVPVPILRHVPPPLAQAMGPASETPGSELQLTDPYHLSQAAIQVVMLLEQQPTPLRSPLPRPRLETFFPDLAGWDYVAEELIDLKQAGKIQPLTGLTLTVPPPAYKLPDKTIKRLAPLTNGPEQLEFIYALLLEAGLIQPGSPTTIWPEVKEQFLRLSAEAQRATLVHCYFYNEHYSELWRLLRRDPALQLKRAWQNMSYLKPEYLTQYLLRFRQLTLRVLACLPNATWVPLDDILPWLRLIWPRFDGLAWQRGYYYQQDNPSWYLTYHNRRLQPDQNEADWDLAQGRFIRALISGPLYWLGLADLRFDDDHLTAVRLHNLADLFWDKVEAPQPPQRTVSQTPVKRPEEAIIFDGLRISVIPSAIEARAHSFLDKIARLDQAAPGQFVYRLDPQVVHETFEAGLSLVQLQTEWAKQLPVEMPPLIQHTLAHWWEGYGQVRLYRDVTVIEFADDHALLEMKTVTSLEKYLLAEISPRLVMIPAGVVDLLTAELEKAGYTPKQTEAVE